jgi:hypothetical protein
MIVDGDPAKDVGPRPMAYGHSASIVATNSSLVVIATT